MTYDYLIIGAGFFGATFARLATDAGKKCVVLESRAHIAGNAYTEKMEGIDVHCYGPHIFHTNDEEVWDFANRFTKFNNFILSPKVYTRGKLYSLPFNMNTFYELWGCIRPEQAQKHIESQRLILDRPAENLEEQALSVLGTDIYELIVREYTQKQWMTEPKNLPASILKRIPLRFTYDNNYFDARFQGIPIHGYTALMSSMLDGIELHVETNYFDRKKYWDSQAKTVVFTGKLDEYFGYEYGELQYRTLDFQHETIDSSNFQGVAVINFPELSYPWTRVVEHKHFTKVSTSKTVITREIPVAWGKNRIPCYPMNDAHNTKMYQKYKKRAESLGNVIFGGRLAEYQYYDMDQVISSAQRAFRSQATNAIYQK